mgnify:FL=1
MATLKLLDHAFSQQLVENYRGGITRINRLHELAEGGLTLIIHCQQNRVLILIKKRQGTDPVAHDFTTGARQYSACKFGWFPASNELRLDTETHDVFSLLEPGGVLP